MSQKTVRAESVVNSAPYASFEERKEWMAQTSGRISRPVRIPYPLLVQVKLLEEEAADLQKLTLDFIAHCLSIPPTTPAEEILKRLEAGLFKPDRMAHDLLIPLEGRMSRMLHDVNFHQSSSGLEYPINVRVVHGTPIAAYDQKAYPTTAVHTDIWAGEPADSLQVIIPLMGNVQANYCQWYETDPDRFELYLTNTSDYRSARERLGEVRAISHSFEVGQLYFFDCALPHQTIQKGGGVRLSLDFRLRRLFPYADPSWMPRMRRERGAYDRYYLFPPDPYPFSSFREKLAHEIEALEKLGLTPFAQLRRAEYP